MPLLRQGLPRNSWHHVFSGAISEIPCAATWVESIAAELALPEPQAFAIQVCLEELMSNILRHGRGSSESYWPQTDSTDSLLISVTIDALPDRIAMTGRRQWAPPSTWHMLRRKRSDQPLEQIKPWRPWHSFDQNFREQCGI
jgi:hypothetical protein